MGNGYNHHLHHQKLQHRGTFLPMLCSRTWIKDVHLPKLWQRRSGSSGEPTSPRVSCMGQIKRNNKVTAYTKTNLKYHNSNKPKNLLPAKTHITTTSGGGGSARRSNFSDHYHNYVPVNIVDMDPPLPVIKRVQQPAEGGRDETSLWKRRSGGMALKGLQIHTPNGHH
ncbi:uncharacterized protein LOC132273375 [Cornus florida]|uniref:uncharacterized protein LOC132273375 n=1 Tax=Cornus florida TaxID=4283 RepID=UPI002897E333|nr:uncharacterized protein LOC132273375 [Cornus florida]